MIFKKLIQSKENEKFVFNYYFSDLFLRIFSIFWIGYVVFSYNENIHRPISLYKPVIWFQKWFMPELPSKTVFYLIIFLSIGLCFITIKSKKVIFRILLFLTLLWLNAIKWNYNYFSHVGHLLLLTHFFTIFIPPSKDTKDLELSKAIRWALGGVLATYSMAGFWKFIFLFYKVFIKPNKNKVSWIHENAVELNAIVSAKIWDENLSETSLKMYQIPYVWEIGTIFIFCIQLLAVFAGFNKKVSYLIIPFLIIFHIYNMLFINTFFYTASFVLVILFFPYHKISYLKERL